MSLDIDHSSESDSDATVLPDSDTDSEESQEESSSRTENSVGEAKDPCPKLDPFKDNDSSSDSCDSDACTKFLRSRKISYIHNSHK